MEAAIKQERAYTAGRSIGFVPTMGALHDGHLSLVKRCVAENDVCVVSIFVNPTQFNDPADLETYPRTEAEDCAMLEAAGCKYVFMPSAEEVYPVPDTRVFNLGSVAGGMEGACRPGHFNGVAQVVSKLFAIVSPDRAYFGLKDFQQIAVVRAMVRALDMKLEIIACPIVREADGLALSSRNRRLTKEERKAAPAIHRALADSLALKRPASVSDIRRYVLEQLDKETLIKVEYFEIVDPITLAPAVTLSPDTEYTGCIAAWCGKVRLIDNISYNSNL
jgi:pantoate--beta-alanine ligase